MKSRIALLILALAGIAGGGCARFPANMGTQPKRTITFDITVVGRIDPTRYYFIAIDNDQNPLTGPLPAVARPWGNGWGTGAITHYVEFNASQPGSFGVYRVIPGTDLQAAQYIGVPFEASITNNSTLHVTLDVDTLATDLVPAANLQSLDVNFVTTDQVVHDPNFPGPKSWDALGVSGNNYVSIPIVNNRVFSNGDAALGTQEQAGDMQVPDTNLDLVDWRIEARVR